VRLEHSRDRDALFDEYIKRVAEEHRSKQKEKCDAFSNLLREKKVMASSSIRTRDIEAAIGSEPIYQECDRRDRQRIISEYRDEIRAAEVTQSTLKREQLEKDFRLLLTELTNKGTIVPRVGPISSFHLITHHSIEHVPISISVVCYMNDSHNGTIFVSNLMVIKMFVGLQYWNMVRKLCVTIVNGNVIMIVMMNVTIVVVIAIRIVHHRQQQQQQPQQVRMQSLRNSSTSLCNL
jgi:hypothetical protein